VWCINARPDPDPRLIRLERPGGREDEEDKAKERARNDREGAPPRAREIPRK